MRTLFYSLLAFALPFILHGKVFAGNSNDKNEKSLAETSYDITISDHDQALVEYTFTVTDSILRMSGIGAEQFENRWGEFIVDPTASSENGESITVTPLSGGRWALDAREGQVVKLNYRVLLDHENHEWSGGIDGVAYKKDYGVFYTGRSLFIMNGRGKRSITVSFHLPENWEVSTVWDQTDLDRAEFHVNSYSELSESMLFAGLHEQLLFEREGFELLFAMGGKDIIAKKQEYENLASGVLDYYIELMGGVPNPSPENPFHRALVIINPSSQADGEVIGNCISLLESSEPDPMAQTISRFIYAHELFHLWNGKSFFPSDLRCEWFKEGVSNYYTLKSLYKVGVLNEESFFTMLNAFFYKRYATDPGLGSISMTEGSQKHDNWGLIYSGGLFAGISQDMIIRKATDNQQSLDDLMRELYRELGGTDKSYTLEELQGRLSLLSGEEQAPFFETYINGKQPIPLDEFLRMSGLNSKIHEGELKISRRGDESVEELEMIEGFLGEN